MDVHLHVITRISGGSSETPFLGMRRALVSQWEVGTAALILVFNCQMFICSSTPHA